MLQCAGKKFITPNAANQPVAGYFLACGCFVFLRKGIRNRLVFCDRSNKRFLSTLPLICRSRIDSFFTSSTVLEARYPVPSHHRQFSLSPLQVQGMVSIFDPFHPIILTTINNPWLTLYCTATLARKPAPTTALVFLQRSFNQSLAVTRSTPSYCRCNSTCSA